jgi:hypothetical protein
MDGSNLMMSSTPKMQDSTPIHHLWCFSWSHNNHSRKLRVTWFTFALIVIKFHWILRTFASILIVPPPNNPRCCETIYCDILQSTHFPLSLKQKSTLLHFLRWIYAFLIH